MSGFFVVSKRVTIRVFKILSGKHGYVTNLEGSEKSFYAYAFQTPFGETWLRN